MNLREWLLLVEQLSFHSEFPFIPFPYAEHYENG